MNFFSLYVHLATFLISLLDIYSWVIIIYCLLSLVIGYDLGGLRNNRFMGTVFMILARFVEPALRPIRNLLPNTGSLDLSPIILLLLVQVAIPWLLREGIRLFYMA